MAPLCYCLLYLLVRSLSGTSSNSPDESRNPLAAAPVASGEVFQTAEGVCKFAGQRLNWWQAQDSCDQKFGHLALGPPNRALVLRLPNSVWVGQRDASLQRQPQRRAHTTAALVFGERTADRAALLPEALPALGALTACAHIQWDPAATEPAALFSLAAPVVANALQLRAFAEPGGFVRAALVVRGHHAPFNAIFRSDGRWHHVCATWEQRGGRWALFADGRWRAGAHGLSAGQPVPPEGVLVLGQDQDSLGGGFSARDSFGGNLTDFHLWDRALSPAQVRQARACAPPPGGLLFRWDPKALNITTPLLPAVPVRLLCPETFQQLRNLQSWPHQDFISRVNTLANATVLLPSLLSEAPGILSLDKASRFLGLLERVLTEETGPLGPVTLLAILQFLKRVTALKAGEPELTKPWEELGRGFMSVASLALEEQSASAWLSVSEVAGGPMTLVTTVQHLASLLSSTLTSAQPRIHIQHRLAGLEVQSLSLRDASTGGHTFTVPGGHPDGPGHIRIPGGEVRRLLGKGLSEVTVIHSWFTSSIFQHTLGASGLKPQAPDDSEDAKTQRFLSTQVGSAILSSETWDTAGRLSTAVTFRLQHQAQVPCYSERLMDWSLWLYEEGGVLYNLARKGFYSIVFMAFPKKILEPVCAFWNFSTNSDAGGSWATTGCSVLTLHPDSTTCLCNHSTSFAILLQLYEVQAGPEEESLLRTLSFVGCGVSLCALATTFLLFLVAGVPTSERTTIHKNLTFSLASAEGFLMTSEWAKVNKVACVAVTAAMHLLFLVAFSWMLAEGLLLWSKVVAVSIRPGPRMRLYYAAGWGVPVAIVAVTLAMHPHDYVASGHCWLNVHTDAIWAFVGLVLFVLTANTCILVRVVMVTVSSTRYHARMLSPQPGLQQKIKFQMWAMMKPVLVLLPVLGLTWLVGLLVHLSPTWAYAAVGLNSFQGPYIFLVYAACNGEVQSALRRTTEKKAAEVLKAEQASGPLAVTQKSPMARDPLSRSVTLRGTHGPRMPTAFSSITEPRRPAVELTAFRTSAFRVLHGQRASAYPQNSRLNEAQSWQPQLKEKQR